MRRVAFRVLLAVIVLTAITAVTTRAAESDNRTDTVEQTFSRRGPWAVTTRAGADCCDTTGAAYDLWYPTDLGAHGVRHPIVTWGIGTNSEPDRYAYLLEHLASWGFVVIATENRDTGSGVDIAAAAHSLVEAAADPGSPFHDRLNTRAVAAVGHSQGGAGALNALADSHGAIETAVPFELPAQAFCSAGRCADTGRLTSGSVLFVNGSEDALISPSNPPPWRIPGLQSNRSYYDATPPAVTKAWGTLRRANHNDVEGVPDCRADSAPCTTGVHGYLGYPTAWLMARLWDHPRARAAFEPGTGEFYRPNPNWANQIGAVAD